MKLAVTLRDIPDEFFYNADRRPDYNGIFAYVLRKTFDKTRPDFKMLCRQIEAGEVVNLSSFQRSVAAERERRERK